jgi:alpha-galactosidase
MAEIIYFGQSLPLSENLAALYDAQQIDVTGGMLDENPRLSICPEASNAFQGVPGLVVRDAQGALLSPAFQLNDFRQSEAKLDFAFADRTNGIDYRATFEIDTDTHLIKAQAFLTTNAPVRVEWFAAPVLPSSQKASSMLDFSGRWCGEFQINETAWQSGIRSKFNPTGRTGHEHFPGLIVPEAGCTNINGRAVAVHYAWSGGHQMVAEELPDGRRQIQFGHTPNSEFAAGTQFQTAPLYFTFSNEGLNGCAVSFQRHIRDKLVQWPTDKPRPVHYNCWEAVYFDHKLEELKDIATRAHELGAERFVLDDGWFGKRDDDTSSLGDWTIDQRKYPDGLTPFIEHVTSLGMGFGIWFEPEMVNEDSELFRGHPDWVLGPSDQICGRQQMVLNMALSEVQDYLFEKIDAVLADNQIEYVKWDHNRVLPFADANQIRGTYALLDRLRKAHPHVEFESCASGGGRIDMGILERTHRVWLSDSNDAIERLHIQHNAALFLPAAITGSHVGPRTCHTSGRVLDISLRSWTAAQRHMGFEMDPRELTDKEAQTLKTVTSWWKNNRDWMMNADILRLDTLDEAVIAEQHLSADKSRFVAFIGKVATSKQIAPRPVALANLDPTANYKIELVNRKDAVGLSRGDPALKTRAIELSGAYLLNNGINVPWSFPNSIWVIEGSKIK